MVSPADRNIQGEKTKSLAVQLGAYIYYEKAKNQDGKVIQFEDLDPLEAKVFVNQAYRFLLPIDKCNMREVPKLDEKKEQEKAMKNKDILTGIIRDFVKGVKHPPRVSDFFPCEELALRILG